MSSQASSVADWLKAIEKELPEGMSIDQLNVDVFEGIHEQAYAHHVGQFPLPINRPYGWRKTAYIDPNSTVTNADLLRMLGDGADSLYLCWNGQIDLPTLFQGVHFEYLTTIIEPTSADLVHVAQQFVTSLESSSNISLIDGTPSAAIYEAKNAHKLTAMEDILIQIQKAAVAGVKNIVIHTNVGPNFFGEIARQRAYRILVANLLHWTKQDIKVQWIAHTESPSQDQGQALIALTYEVTSAILGTADQVAVPLTTDPNFDRLCLNIQHLLEHESHLQTCKDALAGSYYVESLTDKISEKVWEEFGKKGGFV